MAGPLSAPHHVSFRYDRSVGGATEEFLRGLSRRQLLASRTADGRVVVPPIDHDPVSGAPVRTLVPVADRGEVRSWTWVHDPAPEHPLDRPFGFALIQLDGADTTLLHVVDVDDPADLTTGARVRADWCASPDPGIRAIRAFVLEGAPTSEDCLRHEADTTDRESPVTVPTEVRVPYTFEPGVTLSDFYRTLATGRITGGRCGPCQKVYVPPRGSCPACGDQRPTVVTVADTGVVTSFAVVHLPVAGMEFDLPFAWAWIQLDGADVAFAHLIGDIPPEEIHVGQRIRAVWAPQDERPASWEAVRHFRPVTT